MKIFIMRHGQAEPMRVGHTDKHRKLTDYGQQQVARIAGWMQNHHYQPDLIIASPFKRTRDTAEIVHQILDVNNPIEFEDCLLSGEEPLKTLALIEALGVTSILLVSHMPLVAELTALLAPSAMLTGFSPASIVKIRYDRDIHHGLLMANIAPEEVI